MADTQLIIAFSALTGGYKVILHVDLDCFYCQVEQVRLGLDPEQPMAVQQWQGLIAVNYPARRIGLSKQSNVPDALKLCPDIRLVHVATYAGDGQPAAYHDQPKRQTHKVSLEPYRQASDRIIKILKTFTPEIQKASIDEAYIDATSIVVTRLQELLAPEIIDSIREQYNRERNITEKISVDVSCPPMSWHTGTHIIADENATSIEDEVEAMKDCERNGTGSFKPNDPTLPEMCSNWRDIFINVGAAVAADVRKKVYDELCYTCSIGIAHNKLLAKLGSGLNKPNQQTAICESGIKQVLRNYPLRKLKYFSGKLGEELQTAYDVKTPADVWRYSLDELEEKINIKNGAQLIYNSVRGIGDSELKARQHIGSMNSVKTFFTPLKTMEEMEQWIDTLAVELYTRLQDEYEANNRWPSKLSFQYSVGNSETSAHRAYHSSKKVAMISRKELVAPDLLGNRVLRLLREMPEPTPCRGMCLSVGQFKEELDPSMSIKRFFKASTEIAVTTTTTTPSPAIATNTIQVPRPASPNLKTQISTRSRVINEFFKGKTTDNHAVLPDTNVIPNDSNDNDNDIQDEFKILCEQCGKYISPSEQQEHQDFHLAMSLMEQERNEFRQSANLISRECNNTSANNVSSSSSSSSSSSNSSNSIKKKATTAKRTNSTRKADASSSSSSSSVKRKKISDFFIKR